MICTIRNTFSGCSLTIFLKSSFAPPDIAYIAARTSCEPGIQVTTNHDVPSIDSSITYMIHHVFRPQQFQLDGYGRHHGLLRHFSHFRPAFPGGILHPQARQRSLTGLNRRRGKSPPMLPRLPAKARSTEIVVCGSTIKIPSRHRARCNRAKRSVIRH